MINLLRYSSEDQQQNIDPKDVFGSMIDVKRTTSFFDTTTEKYRTKVRMVVQNIKFLLLP